MITQIRAILLADPTLMGIINDVVPTPTDRLDNVIMYEVSPVSDDGITCIDRVKLTTICDSEAQWGTAKKHISKLLITRDDRPLTNTILKVVVNGGGSLYDVDRQKYHKSIFLYITTRS